MMRFLRTLAGIMVVSLLLGCTSEAPIPTPLPQEFVPTAIAMTLEAQGVKIFTATPVTPTLTPPPPSLTPKPTRGRPTNTPTRTPYATRTLTPTITPTPTVTLTPSPTSTSTPILSGTITNTPFPPIPEGRIQIFKIGELSRMVSPISLNARLLSQVGKVARIELWGEDGRLLNRQVKVFYDLPWHVATLSVQLEFEISAAAELGRLVISVEDVYGRLIDVNSVNLILLSSGETELNPATALWQAIYIQEPLPNTMIQGGIAYVSGLARPNTDQPLRVALIDESGHVLGQRLAGVSIPVPGGYGTFNADVPYSVTEVTPALLVIYEVGDPISSMTYLSSTDIILSP